MPKVLIVDDDRAMTALLKTMLEMEPEGFEVAVVARGGQAMEKAQANPPDVMIVDYHLHDMEGVDLIRQIRQDQGLGHTPIIMASGLDVEKEAMSAGADLFLIKPFEPGDLAGIIMQVMGS